MGMDIKDPHILHVTEALQAFCAKVDESIEKEQQQLKACRKKTELETKLAHEMKLNCELTERLAELSRRGGELDRVCAAFESKLTIADSDQNRLDSAKEIYQIAKELTGIRFDFVAPPNIAKGFRDYIVEIYLTNHLFKMRLVESPNRWACEESEETMRHIMCSCDSMAGKRMDLFGSAYPELEDYRHFAPSDILKLMQSFFRNPEADVKNPARKILQPFSIDTQSEDSEALWSLMQCADKENTPHPNNRDDERARKVL